MRKITYVLCICMLMLSGMSCSKPVTGPQNTLQATGMQSVAPPTPAPTPTPSPLPTPETPDSAGSGDVIFDIYRNKAVRDINSDAVEENIVFVAGETDSKLFINEKPYDVPKAGLAQLFAITDVKKGDKILEFVFTDKYNPSLPQGKYAFSYLYWWNGTDLLFMGGLMDVKFDQGWRSAFKSVDHFDAKGLVMCLTDTDELTYLLYMGHYNPAGSKRVLEETRYTAGIVGETKKLKCKKPCLLLKNITDDYYNSAYDYYWIPTLWPYTAGRVPNVSEGIAIIAQTNEYLTITRVYGKRWFKLKTSDGYQGWIYCNNKEVSAYTFTMGWKAGDMFSGL